MEKTKLLFRNQYFLEIISLFGVMLLAYSINEKWNYIAGILLILYGLGIYTLISVIKKDLFDLSAIMLAGWICPLGLSLFRIASYQQPWETVTWICYFLLPACFIIGYAMRQKVLNRIIVFVSKIEIKKHFNSEGKGNILFWFAIIWFLLGAITFFAKWYAAGILPLFSNKYDAYYTFIASTNYFNIGRALEKVPIISTIYYMFLSKGWFFFYPLWVVPALLTVYGNRYTTNVSKKVICVTITLLTIMMTLAAVSRELFLMIMVTMAVILYNLYGKRIIIVMMMVVATLGGFAFLSIERNVSTESINQVMYITENPNYDPATSQVGANITETDITETDITETDITETDIAVNNEQNNEINEDIIENNQEIEYSKPLPGLVAWAYGYFTTGYDNMNYMVKKLDKYFYGAMQLNPVFLVTGPEWLGNLPKEIEQDKYRVAPGLTVYTFMKDSYIDFGPIGVAVSMLVWGLLFGLFAEGFKKYGHALCLIIYACFVHHIVFVAFVSWMSNFSYIFSLGIIVILYLIMKFKRISEPVLK